MLPNGSNMTQNSLLFLCSVVLGYIGPGCDAVQFGRLVCTKFSEDHRTPFVRVEGLLYFQDIGGDFLRNCGTYVPNCTTSQPLILRYEFSVL